MTEEKAVYSATAELDQALTSASHYRQLYEAAVERDKRAVIERDEARAEHDQIRREYALLQITVSNLNCELRNRANAVRRLQNEVSALKSAFEEIDRRTMPFFQPIVVTNSDKLLFEIRQLGNIARNVKDGDA